MRRLGLPLMLIQEIILITIVLAMVLDLVIKARFVFTL